MRGRQEPRCGPALRDLSVIPNGAILVRDGIVVEAGPSRRLENLQQAREAIEINAAGRVVMPGFVDCHTHLVFPAAGAGEDSERGVRAIRSFTAQRLEFRARAHLEAMARHGTTTVEVKTGCGPDESAESKVLRVLSSLRYNPVDLIPSFLFRLPASLNGNTGAAAEFIMGEFLPKIRRRGTALFADLAWDPDPNLTGYFDRYLESARGMGFACKIHADRQSPQEAIAMALRHRVVSIDHLEHAGETGASRLADAGIIATLLPCAGPGSGCVPPARTLIDAGVPIALGTNFNPYHTPTLNMQAVVAMACWRFGMTTEEAITAATVNSAWALGCAGRVGSLEPGKSADLVLLNANDYRDLSGNLGTNLVHMTLKRGRLIYKEGVVGPRSPEALVG
ncbi:MAG TPA: amidohydrolase family protein [Candidatus Solibacter sp.]|nr:amidohydrolase family protein [Candidatus Solibacter sp.]